MALHELEGVPEVAGLLFEVLQGAPPEGTFVLVAAAEGEDYGKRDLALPEIVAHGLAESRLLGRIIEHVVDHLEGDAEIHAEGLERILFHLGAFGDDGADAAGGGEQLGRLRLDNVEIGGLTGFCVVGGDQLHYLALGDHRRGFGKDGQYGERAVLHHQLEGAAEQEVADQHAGLVAPYRVGRGEPAAQVALVDHVVVEQGRGVDEFDAGGEGDMAPAGISAHAGRYQGQQGSEPFAPGDHDVAGQLRYQRHRAVHAPDDEFIDRFQVVGGKGRQRFQGRPFPPFTLKAYDNAHDRTLPRFLTFGGAPWSI